MRLFERVSVMGHSRALTVYRCGACGRMSLDRQTTCEHPLDAVEAVEYVPAEQLRGAVEEIYRGTLTPAALDAALCSVSNDIDGNVSVADVIEALHHERGR